jgi:hypothetical protein
MDEKMKNKLDAMDLDKASGGRAKPGWWDHKKGRPRLQSAESGQNENANSMAANVDVTQNSRWGEVAKVKPD